MSKFEISLASGYVPNWTVVDAIRELFQNAIDQETADSSKSASWAFSGTCLQISNAKTYLTRQSLLLGGTTKADNEQMIGKFGEGYKVAALVLLRYGKTFTIYNCAKNEIWSASMVKSRRYGTDVLTFTVEKMSLFAGCSQDLTIEVGNLTQDEWDNEIIPSNLHLQEGYWVLHETAHGEILNDVKHAGMIFVGGLYVCKYDQYHYGYNFKPGQIRLDRDRKLVSDFDLKWLASKMWYDMPDALDLVEKGYEDVRYISDVSVYTGTLLSEKAFERFSGLHGPHAVPVVTQEQLTAVPRGYTGYIVSQAMYGLITKSRQYVAPVGEVVELKPLERLLAWYKSIQDRLTAEEENEFDEIYGRLEDETR